MQVIHLDVLDIAASIGMATILGITVAVPSYYYAMTSSHGLGLWSIMKARPSHIEANTDNAFVWGACMHEMQCAWMALAVVLNGQKGVLHRKHDIFNMHVLYQYLQ